MRVGELLVGALRTGTSREYMGPPHYEKLKKLLSEGECHVCACVIMCMYLYLHIFVVLFLTLFVGMKAMPNGKPVSKTFHMIFAMYQPLSERRCSGQ